MHEGRARMHIDTDGCLQAHRHSQGQSSDLDQNCDCAVRRHALSATIGSTLRAPNIKLHLQIKRFNHDNNSNKHRLASSALLASPCVNFNLHCRLTSITTTHIENECRLVSFKRMLKKRHGGSAFGVGRWPWRVGGGADAE